MELVLLLCAVSLLHSCEAQESSAVTPVFVQKGEDVVLNVTIADVPEEDTVTWKFNKTVNLVRFLPGKEPKVSDDYSGRIELLEKYSVKLKNLQEADSGVYIAVVSGDREKQITGYKITVQESEPTNVTALVLGVIGIVFICILIVAAVRYFRKREKNETESRENTVYEVPQVRPRALPQSESEVIGLSPTSTYSLVGLHTGSVDSSTTRGTTLPESLYAQVDKPARSLNK
ncbi:uncharacterized protein LOC118495806 [Sander lucioperca]|uniref:uncharacterized protein LOC118495806 n=1 Tax=Sander lucioperca TaxID=283035 RepID=UPI001653992A|nr:uncharacterized protein LOC118495806 [Sander lucioperca]